MGYWKYLITFVLLVQVVALAQTGSLANNLPVQRGLNDVVITASVLEHPESNP